MSEAEQQAIENNLRRLETQLIRFGCVFETDAKQLITLIRKEILCQDTLSSPA